MKYNKIFIFHILSIRCNKKVFYYFIMNTLLQSCIYISSMDTSVSSSKFPFARGIFPWVEDSFIASLSRQIALSSVENSMMLSLCFSRLTCASTEIDVLRGMFKWLLKDSGNYPNCRNNWVLLAVIGEYEWMASSVCLGRWVFEKFVLCWF